MIQRRRFLARAGTAATVGLAALADAPSVIAQPKVQWRLSTAWPPQLDNLQGAAQRLGQLVDEMSGGRFRIEVFPGGQIMAPFECFDATSKGTIEAYMAAASYWASKEPAAEWFISIPFGMDPQGMAVWCQQGDGLKLWEETYAPFGVVPRLGPGFAPQMGGWYRKKINTVADYKGLKMRMAGLGSRVIARAGATPVLTPAAEIYAAFERGVIDACEWVGPHDDLKLGLQNTARYYYYPGWHEPGTVSEFGFNAVAIERIRTELKGKVELVQFPAPVLRDLKKLAGEVIREQSEKSPMARKVHASFTRFQALLGTWENVAEGAYHQLLRA